MKNIELFVQACIDANSELYKRLEEGFDESLCQQLAVGAGGDISRGVDIMAEKIFLKHLKSFGEIDSEESGCIGSGTYKIIIDPIDGSDNFLSKIPYYGASIALEKDTKVIVGVISNLANGDIFIKTDSYFHSANLKDLVFKDVKNNACATVGIFERAYRSKEYAKKLFNAEIKYRIPGAVALSLAYAHDVSFVLFEGRLRDYDAKAGLFMCENLYKYEYNGLLLICKDIKQFEFLKNILLGDEA